MVLQRKCNRCGFKGELSFFLPSDRYKYGYRPLCLKCKALDGRTRRETKRKEYRSRNNNELEANITPEGLDILINNGFARNREEALRYIQ